MSPFERYFVLFSLLNKALYCFVLGIIDVINFCLFDEFNWSINKVSTSSFHLQLVDFKYQPPLSTVNSLEVVI